MNAKIRETADMILDIYTLRREELEPLSTTALTNLQHECEELRHDGSFSVRTAAEINRTACVMLLERRA